MIVGGYSLDLYCDKENHEHLWNEFPHKYTGEFGSDCRAQARRDGWKLKAYVAICPKCAKKEEKKNNA